MGIYEKKLPSRKFPRLFQLEQEIAMYCQGNLSIQNYYSGFLALWTKYIDNVYAYVMGETLSGQEIHRIKKQDQFLMKLHSGFENV